MSQIKSKMSELDSIKQELSRLNKQVTTLRKQKKEIEEFIQQYLKDNNKSGIKFNGKIISLKEGTKSIQKKLRDKRLDTTSILNDYGIRNCEEIVEKIIEAQKGNTTTNTTLKIN
jgi:hypothetical protein